MNEISLMPEEQYRRLQQRNAAEVKELWDLLDQVKDPEVPVLSIWDLGILRDVERDGDRILVTITPTYSGCPAMNTITDDVIAALKANGYDDVEVKTKLSPAWSSEWMSPEGRRKLRNYGIAPPEDAELDEDGLTPDAHAQCPHCGSRNTRRISEFGSTACKALFQCNDCNEPFDYFKKI
ncbi:1,2-phenylacetyl-CoA epoxidase subunit PaaD [Marinobacterium sediminicola]|uniref:Ring-1,2-phenylacetyl-CoA epoxidase subunit PaaD n=1 Tax=Marinobacterium sediminicola TaxID=518898 RepID=A0ABY1RW51_9GAMM|nr:1,2-phenylacetyl-CoA epoxidase subunit PaaD [Marinobacterium sediminicola]ULG70509.1 phenylacetate-CoA oxygenase subunit PaaJ [Marinobacterium sediminicola]SMR69135.1 ring-1,2-phenylacetyl-CoA epoxidase subunit PaaD [Marinobacterium sediminicola]